MLASQAPEFVGDKTLVGTLCERLVRIYQEYGLGYRDTTYRGLLFGDFSADSVPCLNQPPVTIRLAGTALGDSKLNCLVVDSRSAVLIVALREHISAANRAILQTYLR